MLINLIEDYNIKLLSSKVYWENANKREEYKKFYEKYKTISNLKEVSARGAKIITITNIKDNNFADYTILVEDYDEILNPLLVIVPMQMLAYNVAKLRDCDIDKPRNLAKSVTVE